MNLIQAIQEANNSTVTTKGQPARVSTLSDCLDFFYALGGSRGRDITSKFVLAFNESADVATRILLWGRDAREGAGERQIFRDILNHLGTHHPITAKLVADKIPELGRWDDIFSLVGTKAETFALDRVSKALQDGDKLAAKWCPRKGDVAGKIKKHNNWSHKYYRKLVVNLTNAVEQKMCAKQWYDIEYDKLPSVAAARYQSAFMRHDEIGYSNYKDSLKKGETKVNAGAVYPYDVVKSLQYGDADVASAQWSALPDYVAEGKSFLPVVDVSGSMYTPAGGNKTVQCVDVAISLGLYLSERNKSVFKDKFITFSSSPKLQQVYGELKHRVQQLRTADWGMSTDIGAVFRLILSAAVNNNLPQENLPDKVVILSDMQFDRCSRNFLPDAINASFSKFGYTAPSLVFWNLNDYDNRPALNNTKGVILVSGASPAMIKSVLADECVTPMDTMLKTVMNSRYNY